MRLGPGFCCRIIAVLFLNLSEEEFGASSNQAVSSVREGWSCKLPKQQLPLSVEKLSLSDYEIFLPRGGTSVARLGDPVLEQTRSLMKVLGFLYYRRIF